MARLRELLHRFDCLNLRERALVAVALGVLLIQGGGLVIGGAQKTLNDARRQLAGERQVLDGLATRITETTEKLRNDPGRALAERTEQLRRSVQASSRQLKQLLDHLVAPSEMASLLQQMLSRQQDLQLISLETLETRPLSKNDKKADLPVFVHGFALEFRGTYLETLRYLEQLQALSGGIYWDVFELHAEDYPANRVRLELHTLGLSEDWIGV